MLAIERDWRLRKLLRANLEPLGLEVQEAVSGQHGLELLRSHDPDLILLDLDLLGMDAHSLLAALNVRLKDQQVPIILLSAEPPGQSLLKDEQVAAFVKKPFAVAALLQQIERVLGSRSS